MRNSLLSIVMMSVALSACGGGSRDDSRPAPTGTAADAEAGRVAALYRYAQAMTSLALANLTEVDIGERRAGTTPCTSGGSVTYADTTPTERADPTALITFDQCQEAIGVVDGYMEVKQFLVRLQPSGLGDFNVSWNADVTIDGYRMGFESAAGRTTLLAGGGVQIETRNGPDNGAVLTAPNGTFVHLDDAKINVSYSPSTGRVDFNSSVFRIVHPQNSNLGSRMIFGGFTAPVTSSRGVFSVGIPTAGGFSYDRSFDPTSTDLEGNGTTQGGLLSLTLDPLPASRNFPGSAGQYSWELLLEAPLLTLPAEEPV